MVAYGERPEGFVRPPQLLASLRTSTFAGARVAFSARLPIKKGRESAQQQHAMGNRSAGARGQASFRRSGRSAAPR